MDFIKIIPSSTFLSVLEELHTCSDAPKSVVNYFNHKSVKDSKEENSALLLLTSDVKWCHEKMRERGMSHRIHELLNQSEIIFPTYTPAPRNPILEARVQKLREEQANREYQNMTRNLHVAPNSRGFMSSLGQDVREMQGEVNRQLVSGLQYLVSIIGTFFALYVALGFANQDMSVRLVIGLVGGLVVGLAELYFIIRDDLRAETEKKNK